MHKTYNYDFYSKRDKNTEYAAFTILSIVNRLFDIKSAVDIGCGVGTWLRIQKDITSKKNVELLYDGYDGEYVREYLVIDKDRFHAKNLENPIECKIKYDLAISLEVAEHLSENRADSFVSELCHLSNVVLFSAATKGQGGDSHVNEQRLDYWKSIFSNNGYTCYDIIRRQIWNDERIPFWYRQNIVLFVERRIAETIQNRYKNEHIDWGGYSVIHPEFFEVIEARRNLVEKKLSIISRIIRASDEGLIQKHYQEHPGVTVLLWGLDDIGKLVSNLVNQYCVGLFTYDSNINLCGINRYDKLENVPVVTEVIIISIQHYDEIVQSCKRVLKNNPQIYRIDKWLDMITRT